MDGAWTKTRTVAMRSANQSPVLSIKSPLAIFFSSSHAQFLITYRQPTRLPHLNCCLFNLRVEPLQITKHPFRHLESAFSFIPSTSTCSLSSISFTPFRTCHIVTLSVSSLLSSDTPQSLSPGLKPIYCTNRFLHSLLALSRLPLTELAAGSTGLTTQRLFVYIFICLVTCVRLLDILGVLARVKLCIVS